ncbi:MULTISPECIES: ElyC/SanA/YdcF family protein [unclassified Francisella]|uniref:ElyC/SanA/YdcF family protein n=1 Tax=unclassified Francisella TaxID=2610885 RepID=UPI002E322944|nr:MULTISPECIES: ElyC/SanA/YdcF family protein [unclassified Francisella]MED7820340.1 ElyC/SanA/YdcF family protein [Francisella sp. 19S2-4]MED7831175.1 ElyC/SanA/YdcF family protein [Francisella sp. 19S2-10]
MKFNKIIASILIMLPVCVLATNTHPPIFNLDILDHQQNAIADIQYNLSVSKSDKHSGATTKRGNQSGAIQDLKNALIKAPKNSYVQTQLAISLALLEISNNQLDSAKITLDSIGNIKSNNPILQVLLTAYSLVWDPNSFNENMLVLKKSNWQKMPHYIQAIETAKSSFNLKINTSFDKLRNLEQNSLAIVTLGYSLNADGSMSNILIDRLKLTLAAHKKYPNAIIIVSGGVAHQGVTESYQMKQWLTQHKVPTDQIIQEDQSTSTVTNAINTIDIIKRLNKPIKNILLISSDSHIRRASSIFQQELQNAHLPFKLTNMAAKTSYDINKPANKQEKILIIKDTLRTAGIWQMPGMVF